MNPSEMLASRILLLNRFEALIEHLDSFCAAVRQDSALPAWVSRTESDPSGNLDMRLKAIQLYRALWYQDNQDGRETQTCPGIVGASPKTLAAAKVCNGAKDDFKVAVLALKALGRSEMQGAMADLHRRWEVVSVAMRRMGVARLNLKQAYRHIPLLEQRPLKIGFTWSRQGRVIQRIRVTDARCLLEQRVETPQVRLELQRLAGISEKEPLARVRGVCPHLRANIVFAGTGVEVKRRLMQTPLPILVPLEYGERLPEFVPVASEPSANPRLRRADIRIEDEPFLPLIRVHRYREVYR